MSSSDAPAPAAPINRFAPDIANAPTLELAGLKFPIPVLAFAQNRIIEPLLWKVLPVYYKMLEMAEGRLKDADAQVALMASDPTPAQISAAKIDSNARFVDAMSTVTIDDATIDALATVVHTAITRGTPGLARREFDGMTFGSNELFEALNVILPQTGMFRKAVAERASKGDVKTGEAEAGS